MMILKYEIPGFIFRKDRKRKKMLIKNAGIDTIRVSNSVLADCPPLIIFRKTSFAQYLK